MTEFVIGLGFVIANIRNSCHKGFKICGQEKWQLDIWGSSQQLLPSSLRIRHQIKSNWNYCLFSYLHANSFPSLPESSRKWKKLIHRTGLETTSPHALIIS